MMPWFPQDFASATSAWTVVERALYRELLDAQWILGKLPTEPARLARIAHFDLDTFKEAWAIVSAKFEEVNHCFLNKRLEEHRTSAQAFVEQRRRAAKASVEARAQRALEHPFNGRSNGRSNGSAAPAEHPSPSPSLKNKIRNSVLSGEVKPSPGSRPHRLTSTERRSIKTSDPEEIEKRRREAAAIAEALAARGQQ